MKSEDLSLTWSAFGEALSREIVAVALGFTLIAVALAPRNAAALTALLCGGLWPALIIGIRLRWLRRPSRAVLFMLAASAAAVGVLTVRSAFAVGSRVSLWGAVGQHSGALTWVVALLILVASCCANRPGDLGRSARALAIAGAMLAVAALVQRTGLFAAVRFSAEPSGIMENSGSLGQMLSVTLFAAIAWALGSRQMTQRLAAWSCLVVVVAGLAVTYSIGAWVGVGVGGAVGIVTFMLARRSSFSARLTAGVLVGVMIVSIAGLAWMLSDGIAPGLETRLAAASNDRFTIWTSAIDQVAQAPVVGSGAEQFSAWVNWGLDSQSGLNKTATYDPHNLALNWLLSAGLLGAVLALCAASVITTRLFTVLVDKPVIPVAALVAAPIAWMVAVMFVWTGPIALFAVALLVGQVGSAADAGSGWGPSDRLNLVGASAVASVGIAVVLVVFLWGAPAEYRWAMSVDRGVTDQAALVGLATQTGDPSLAVAAFEAVLGASTQDQQSNESQLAALMPALDHASTWHVDSAFARFVFAMRAVVPKNESSWNRAAAGLSAGRLADPGSGLWDSVGAIQASGLGFDEQAKNYARSASAHALPPDVAAALESILAK